MQFDLYGTASKAGQRKKRRQLNPAIKEALIVSIVFVAGCYIWIRIALGIVGIR